MKKLISISFQIEKLDFFALTPFICFGSDISIAVAWLKWGFVISIGK